MKRTAILLAVVLATTGAALAQTETAKPGPKFYRFDFALKEMDGNKALKTRNYQMMVALNGGTSSIRSGARVPVVDPRATTYIDVGVNLDVRNPLQMKDGLEFELVAEVSGTLEGGAQLSKQPMVYQTRWNSRVELELGKPTTVFSSDDPSSKHQMQLEVTATPVR